MKSRSVLLAALLLPACHGLGARLDVGLGPLGAVSTRLGEPEPAPPPVVPSTLDEVRAEEDRARALRDAADALWRACIEIETAVASGFAEAESEARERAAMARARIAGLR